MKLASLKQVLPACSLYSRLFTLAVNLFLASTILHNSLIHRLPLSRPEVGMGLSKFT